MTIPQQVVAVNLIVLDDCQRITQRFIQEAIKEWDRVGEGCFARWIQVMVAEKWLELAHRN